MKTLKFVLITLALFFALVSSEKMITPKAKNTESISTVTNTIVIYKHPSMIPVIPIELSSFECIGLTMTRDLSPEVPLEADFDDYIDPVPMPDSSLVPEVPLTADFNDSF